MPEMTWVATAPPPGPSDKLAMFSMASTIHAAASTAAAAATAAVAPAVTAATAASGAGAATPEQTKQWTADKLAQAELNTAMGQYCIYALAGLLGVAFLLSLPRFLARLYASVQPRRRPGPSRPGYAFESGLHEKLHAADAGPRRVSGGDLWKGWFLSPGRAASRRPCAGNDGPSGHDDPSGHDVRTLAARSHLAPPPHVRTLTSRLPFGWVFTAAPFANWPSLLNTSAETRMLLLVAGYLAATFATMFVLCDLRPSPMPMGPRNNYKRSGIIAMTQVPVALALGVRGNIPGLLIGKSYDHLRIIHKVSGRVCFFASAFHSIGCIAGWAKAGGLAKSSASKLGITGYVAFAGVSLVAVTSLPTVRRAAYGFFKISHVLGILMLLVGLGYHHPTSPPWMWATGALYLFSVLFGLAKTRVAEAEIEALPGTTTTRITVPGITTGWRAGQHVRIRLAGIGLLSAECHPFTIANAPDSPGGMQLLVKAAGDWTTRAYEIASNGGGHRTQHMAETGVARRKCKVIIEGPYGGLGNNLLPTFSSVVLVAGGSGISHSLGLAEDLIHRSPTGVVAARTIDLIWVVRVEQIARAQMPRLNALVARAKMWEAHALDGRRHGADLALPTALRVHIFVTRVPKSSPLMLITGPPKLMRSNTDVSMKNWHYAHGNTFTHTDEKEQLAMDPDHHDGSSESTCYQPSDGHGATAKYADSYDGHGFFASSDGHSSDDYHIRPELTGANTAAEQTKADWLAKNPSTSTLASLHQRQTDCTEPMSSIWAYRGRPDLKASVSTIVDETIARHGRSLTDPRGVFVTACGPEFLVNDSRSAVQRVAEWKKGAVHGVEFEAEFFGV